MAVSAQEKPSTSYRYLHPPAQLARKVKVANFTMGLQQIVWWCEVFAQPVLGSCSGFMLTISGTICIEILFPVYQDWKLI